MNEVMMKNYVMTFSDGSVWAVPVSTIAMHHATTFMDNHNGDLVESLEKGTLPKFKDNLKAIREWAVNNMSWSDVEVDAVKISEPSSINFDHEWVASSVQIK